VRLDPRDVEALADAVADRLVERPKPPPRIVTVAEFAEILHLDPSMVYRHADDWGVLHFGAALRFDLDAALALARRAPSPPPEPPSPPVRRQRRRASDVPLLPVKGLSDGR
jgi:hypothetical protein